MNRKLLGAISLTVVIALVIVIVVLKSMRSLIFGLVAGQLQMQTEQRQAQIQ